MNKMNNAGKNDNLMPNLVGKSVNEAKLSLAEKQITKENGYTITFKPVASEDYVGKIRDTDPIADSKLEKDQSITVNYGKSAKIEIPSFSSEDYEENYREKLITAGFAESNISSVSEESDLKPFRVIRVTPEPGSKVGKNEQIKITYSKEKKEELVQIPDVKGLKYSSARSEIIGAGLSVSNSNCKEADTYIVKSQSPRAGKEVKKKTIIKLTCETQKNNNTPVPPDYPKEDANPKNKKQSNPTTPATDIKKTN